MSKTNEELAAKIAASSKNMVPVAFEKNIKEWFVVNRKRILALVGGSEERAALFIAASFAQVNKIPELLNCKPESFYNCLIYSMGTNLMPGPLQECVFVPFNKEATFIPMYQGLAKLVMQSGVVTKIIGHCVYEADEFDFNPATDEIHHKIPNIPEKERGQRTYTYSRIKNTFGEFQTQVMNAEQVNTIKSRSRAAKSSFSPWNSNYADDISQMWIKTVFRRNAKWVAKSATNNALQLGRALELDNAADTGEEVMPDLLSPDVEIVKSEILNIQNTGENKE